MSWRTIIEINHDTLHDLQDPETIAALVRDMRSGEVNRQIGQPSDGRYGRIRVLGQRHHADTLKLEVK